MKKIFVDSYGRTRSGWQILLAIIVMLLAAIAQGIPYLMYNLLPMYVLDSLAGLAYAAVALALAYAVFKVFYKKQYQGDLDCFSFSAPSTRNLLMGMLLGLLAFTIVVLPLYLTGVYRVQFNASFSLMGVVSMFILFIGVGVVEEIVMRGLMQHALLRFGKWPALIVVGPIFGLLHIFNPGSTINAIVGVTLAGVVLGMSMYATHSIMFPIGFHITWNWVQGMIYGIPVSGTTRADGLLTTEIISTNDLISGGAFGAEASLICIIVLIVLSVILFWQGNKNGNLAKYDVDKKQK